jgi:hypothetical protein
MTAKVPPFGVVIPVGYEFDNMGTCSSCGASIVWCWTRKMNRAPLDPNGTSHFATCPNAADHRRPREAPAPRPAPVPPPTTRRCEHTNLAIAARVLAESGVIGAYDAVYLARCPVDGATRRNTRLAATIHTLRHEYGWGITTRARPGLLAEYVVEHIGTMPEGAA